MVQVCSRRSSINSRIVGSPQTYTPIGPTALLSIFVNRQSSLTLKLFGTGTTLQLRSYIRMQPSTDLNRGFPEPVTNGTQV